jgi:hypothetical protein
MALTGVLLLLGAGAAGLAAAGRLHLGAPAPTQEAGEKTAAEPPAEGRYRIEAAEGVRQLLLRSGRLGFLGEPRVEEAWAFHFAGGFLECQLETDHQGKSVSAGPIPDDWPGMLRRDEVLRASTSPLVRREGQVVVTRVRPAQPAVAELAPYFPHLGGLLVRGPAGPLHQLATLHLETAQQGTFRVFLSAGPPQDSNHGRFNLWTEQVILLREPFIRREPSLEPSTTGGGKDLPAGRPVVLLDRQMGYSRLRLKARFLSDDEVAELRKK